MKNLPRKYSDIRLAGNSQLGTALHQAVDRRNEALGCTLKTGGEIDLVRINYELEHQKRETRRDRYIRNKRKALSINRKADRAPIGTS